MQKGNFYTIVFLFIFLFAPVLSFAQEVPSVEKTDAPSWDEIMKMPVTPSDETSYQIQLSQEQVETGLDGSLTVSFSLKSDQSLADGLFSFDVRSDQSQRIVSAVPETKSIVLIAGQEKAFTTTIKPTLPKQQDGESYTLYLTVTNTIGVRILEAPLGAVSAQGGVALYSLRDCVFTDSVGEKVRSFLPLEGADVAIGETLPLTCLVQGAVPEDGSIFPVVTWYERNYQTGIKVNDKVFGQDAFVRKNESTILNLDVTSVLQKPQAYDAVVALKNSAGELVSNEVAMHFVIRGASATIQSIRTDKMEYGTSDTAKIYLVIAGPADNFPQTRGETTSLENTTLQVRLADDKGRLCGETKQNIDFEKSLENTVSVSVTKKCSYPTVSVTVYNGTDVLAERSVDLGSVKLTDAPVADVIQLASSNKFFVITSLVGLVIILGIVLMLMRRKGGKRMSLLVFTLFLLGSSAFLHATPAYAGQMSGGPNFLHGTDDRDTQGYYSYYMSYPGNSIEPGEFIRVWYNWQYTGCSNEYHAINWTPYSSWGAGLSYQPAGTLYYSSCRICSSYEEQCSYQFVTTPYPHWENVCTNVCTEYGTTQYFSQIGSWPNPGSPWECTHESSIQLYNQGFYAPAPGTHFVRHYFTLPGNSATHDQWFSVACATGKVWNGSSCVVPSWSAWGACSATCGTGYQYRTCSVPGYCSGDSSRVCNTQACGTPANLKATCNATGDQITYTWNPVGNSSGAYRYLPRMDNTSNGWLFATSGCGWGWMAYNSGDYCGTQTANSMTAWVTPGVSNNFWVHSYGGGANASAAASISKACYICTGAVPTNATLCTNDDQGLTANTARSLVSTCTAAKKCEYKCDPNYSLVGGVCVPNPTIDSFTLNGQNIDISVSSGTNVTFAWSASNATYCTVQGLGFVSSYHYPYPAEHSVTKTAGTTVHGTYTLRCYNNSGGFATASRKLTVTCPETWGAWSACLPECSQSETGTQSRSGTKANCDPISESRDCSVPKCRPDGFQEVNP